MTNLITLNNNLPPLRWKPDFVQWFLQPVGPSCKTVHWYFSRECVDDQIPKDQGEEQII